MTATMSREVEIDWDRVQELYEFSRARADDRLHEAQRRREREQADREQHDLHVLETMYAKARQHRDVVAACAVTYFRAKALRDAQHPEFRGVWITQAE